MTDETLRQSVKRTAEYPFFCCCMTCVTARRLGNWLIFFFESMMDDDDGRGEGGRNVHQIPPPVHEQLQMPNRKGSLVFFFFRHFSLWSKRLILLQLINVWMIL